MIDLPPLDFDGMHLPMTKDLPPYLPNHFLSLLLSKSIHPLKLVIMSATLRTKDFTENEKLFPVAPPVINVRKIRLA